MSDVMAEGGVISKEIKRIFQSIREIIDKDQEWDWAQNIPLGHSSLDSERR